jgi:hypothetical protein
VNTTHRDPWPPHARTVAATWPGPATVRATFDPAAEARRLATLRANGHRVEAVGDTRSEHR